ncbi:MAG: HesA/MoeB/ThiF family protein [Candidatus Nanoarchaeia archaeon]|nr:HesA/MoeB/ThiF family protein [Candidatus Haiyanarchaeum thermophilum]MCW1302777.1 HesA/MoeB/ThiF family protein [Candidatus Haiyanarchaeum thermophilum]MCW1304125.1 HesA/MoeB/ThiF family protein [Candidatus Haiyanarchaeum thermophilum]MCW1306638.1 HesA/MoeB/ThiF family protein [Candidatus Haiyanarchaeum thermophilum]MCW1307406.1 HesA/MoeB/ThiF family protein [Candidatus Haiyanarchaeum thermophilum]
MDPSWLERYARQILIPGFGKEAQVKVKNGSVAIIGLGGLGSIVSIYLTAAGVGELIVVDRDKFQRSDLNRQILADEKSLGKYKVDVALSRLRKLNSDVNIMGLKLELSRENINKIGEVNVVVDCTDNWETRLLINEYCVSKNIPLVHAGVAGFRGHITTILPFKSACLKCIFPHIAETTGRVGVIGATPALFGALEVLETIKLLTGIGRPLFNKIMFIDAKEMQIELIPVRRNKKCPVCGSK